MSDKITEGIAKPVELGISRGADVHRQMNQMRARLIARYKLTAVPGRPEELVQIGRSDLGVSFGYGSKTIRVRGMKDRRWLQELTADFQIKEGWGADLYALLDHHFGFVYKPENEISDRRSPREPLPQFNPPWLPKVTDPGPS